MDNFLEHTYRVNFVQNYHDYQKEGIIIIILNTYFNTRGNHNQKQENVSEEQKYSQMKNIQFTNGIAVNTNNFYKSTWSLKNIVYIKHNLVKYMKFLYLKISI